MAYIAQKEREVVRETTTVTTQASATAEGSLADIAPKGEMVKKAVRPKRQAIPVVKPKMHKELQRSLAAASYLNVLFLVPLLFPVKDEFVNFHLRQGIVLFAIGTLVSFVAWGSFYAWLGTGLSVGAIAVFASVQAAQGRKWKMPILGVLAKKIALE